MSNMYIITPRDTRSVNTYFKEINRFPLLNAAEEKALAIRIQDGSKKALDTLVNSNLRFVITMAKKHMNKGLDLEDLIANGNLGLIRAAERFDPSADCRFTSYAKYWIEKFITDALTTHSRTVSLPQHLVDKYNKAAKFCEKFEQREHRKPTTEEVAAALGMTTDQVARLFEGSTSLSVDSPLKDNENKTGTLTDIIEDASCETPEDYCEHNLISSLLDKSIALLPERERRVISMLFPLDNTEPCPVEAICDELHLSRESIRLIKNRALKHLRSHMAA